MRGRFVLMSRGESSTIRGSCWVRLSPGLCLVAFRVPLTPPSAAERVWATRPRLTLQKDDEMVPRAQWRGPGMLVIPAIPRLSWAVLWGSEDDVTEQLWQQSMTHTDSASVMHIWHIFLLYHHIIHHWLEHPPCSELLSSALKIITNYFQTFYNYGSYVLYDLASVPKRTSKLSHILIRLSTCFFTLRGHHPKNLHSHCHTYC